MLLILSEREPSRKDAPQAFRRLRSSTRSAANLEEAPDAAHGCPAQNELEEDAGATDE